MPRICFTTIMVDDMAMAQEFYAAKLGFTIARRDNYPDFVLLNSDGFQIALHRVDKVTWADYPNQAAVIPGIEVEDLEASIERLSQQGVDFIHESPQRFFAGRYAALRDPAGNVLELIEMEDPRRDMPPV